MNNKISIVIIFLLVIAVNIDSVQAELTLSKSDETPAPGEINHDIFNRTLPGKMKIGDSYNIKIFVKNTGDERNIFRVILITNKVTIAGKIANGQSYGEYIYPRYASEVLELDKGESRMVEFTLVPVKPYIGEIDISTDLYYVKSKEMLKNNYVLADHAEKKINIIEPAFAKNEQDVIKFVILFILLSILMLILRYTGD